MDSTKQSEIHRNLFLLSRFCNTYGFAKGLSLFIKFKLKKTENLKVPGIQYPISLSGSTAMSDRQTFYQLFLDGEYDIKFEDIPKVIIDGGANIGLFAVQMKNKFPDATIICVEPDPENFRRLQKNVRSYNNIFCENCGIWNSDTKLKVYDKYNAGQWGMVVEEDKENGAVPAISIDSLMKKYSLNNVDILKLDIETSEKQVFSGNFDTWMPKIKTIVIELHDWMEDGCSKNFFDVVTKHFKKYKYLVKGENTIIINQNAVSDFR